MAAYLNQNFYGNRSYGIKAAAKSYFGIDDLSKLTLAQAAILAAIPQSPTTFDLIKNAEEQCSVTVAEGKDCPAGKTQLAVPADSAIVQRRNYILDLMQNKPPLPLTKNTFSAADFDAARKADVILTPPVSANWLAPHFVWQVRHQLGSILCGEDQADTCEAVDTGGYKVITSLDYGLQKKAEKWVKAAAIAPNRANTAGYLKSINVSYAPWIRNLKGRGVYNAALGRHRLPHRPDPGLRRQRLVLREAARQEVPAPVRRPGRWLAPARVELQADQLPDRDRGRDPQRLVPVHGRRDQLRRRLRAGRRRPGRAWPGPPAQRHPAVAQHPGHQGRSDQRSRSRL